MIPSIGFALFVDSFDQRDQPIEFQLKTCRAIFNYLVLLNIHYSCVPHLLKFGLRDCFLVKETVFEKVSRKENFFNQSILHCNKIPAKFVSAEQSADLNANVLIALAKDVSIHLATASTLIVVQIANVRIMLHAINAKDVDVPAENGEECNFRDCSCEECKK